MLANPILPAVPANRTLSVQTIANRFTVRAIDVLGLYAFCIKFLSYLNWRHAFDFTFHLTTQDKGNCLTFTTKLQNNKKDKGKKGSSPCPRHEVI